MVLANNQEMYSTWEFDRWAYGETLYQEDWFLLENYLDKNIPTLEAGTGGGRMLLAMQQMGFTSLRGFDYVPEFIAIAKERDQRHSIHFEVQDATHLTYPDNSFQQLVYMQNVIGSIETEEDRLQALREAYRILRPGGTILFGFLNFDVRLQNPLFWLYINYLRISRWFAQSPHTLQEQPWLQPGGKPNLYALVDQGPYVYWYRAEEAYHQLAGAGFQILAFGTSSQIHQGKLQTSLEEFLKQPISGGLYFVCSK